MRLLRIALVALVAAPIAAAAGGPTAHNCSASTSLRLPASLDARTARGTFSIKRDGRVCRVSAATSPVPDGTAWWPSTAVWVKSEHRHLVVGRRQRTLWRSHGRFAHEYRLGSIALGGHELAFSYGIRTSRLYVAALNGHEHVVAHGEFPIGWTRGGLYVGRDQGGAILLRSGTVARPIPGAEYRTAAYETSTGNLYFVDHGRLFRANGSRRKLVAALAGLGLHSERNLQVLLSGGLVVLENMHRLVVLRTDGSVVSSTRLPLRKGHSDSLSDQPVASRTGVVAFAAMHPDRRIVTQVIERGNETVYLLRPGARTAVPIHVERMRFNVCGHGATLAWRGRWLLYSVGEGPAAVIDTATGHATELSFLIRRLPGFSGVEESGPLSLGWS